MDEFSFEEEIKKVNAFFGYDEFGRKRKMSLPQSVSAENEEEYHLDEINRVKDMK